MVVAAAGSMAQRLSLAARWRLLADDDDTVSEKPTNWRHRLDHRRSSFVRIVAELLHSHVQSPLVRFLA